MKTILHIILPLVLFFENYLFAQTSGGPDNYGYTWRNQDDTNYVFAPAPKYSWREIKGKGTQIIGLGDDNRTGPYNINWNFQFYWNKYDKFWVGSNGWISFQKTTVNMSSPFLTLPNPDAKNTICPMLADLTFLSATPVSTVPGATAWYWSNNVDTLIIQYDSVPFYVLGNTTQYSGRNTFQVILSGVDSSIVFQYKLNQLSIPPYEITTQGLITGIENASGSVGLQVLSNKYPVAKTVVKFYYPENISSQIPDVTPLWNQEPDNLGFFTSYPCGKPVKLKTDIANVGSMPVGIIPVTGQLFNQDLMEVWKDSVSVHSLTAGADSILVFSKSYPSNIPGNYDFRTTTSLFDDIFLLNNVNDVEMVVVDTSQETVHLSYSSASATATGFSWEGGDGGVGVYFVPPFYPAMVTSIDYFISADDGVNSGFIAELIKDDGANGNPGTLLESISVPKSSLVNIPGYHTVTLTNPYVITSGGVYCSWVMNGDSIQLGTDGIPPLSSRNFEYLNGSWSAYRNNYAEDLMIRLNIKGSNTELITNAASQPASCASCLDGNASVTVSGGTPPYTYLWTPGLQTTTAILGMPGTYTVCITDSKGCPKCNSVTINNNTSVKEILNAASININPNPFSSSTNITIRLLNPVYENLSFSIYDIYGREIESVDLLHSSSNLTIDFILNRKDKISSGLYFYKLHTTTQILSAGKFMIQ